MNTSNAAITSKSLAETGNQIERNYIVPFTIAGCTISISSSAVDVINPLDTVKEILLSAYRKNALSC